AGNSGVKPGAPPHLVGASAPEYDPVVQAERTLLPEFDFEGDHSEARPVSGARRLSACELLFEAHDGFFQHLPVGKRAGLLGRPGADPAAPRAGRVIGVRFRRRHLLDMAANPDLALQRLPVEAERRPWPAQKLAALRALVIRV